jgi:hypothetical protein
MNALFEFERVEPADGIAVKIRRLKRGTRSDQAVGDALDGGFPESIFHECPCRHWLFSYIKDFGFCPLITETK